MADAPSAGASAALPGAALETAKRARDPTADAPEEPATKKLASDGEDNSDSESGRFLEIKEALEKAIGVKTCDVAPKANFEDAVAVWEAMRDADPGRCLSDGNVDKVDPDELDMSELGDIQDTISNYANGAPAAFAVCLFNDVDKLADAGRYIHVAQEYLDGAGLASSVTAAEITERERMLLIAAVGDKTEFGETLDAFAEDLEEVTDIDTEVASTMQFKRCVLVIH